MIIYKLWRNLTWTPRQCNAAKLRQPRPCRKCLRNKDRSSPSPGNEQILWTSDNNSQPIKVATPPCALKETTELSEYRVIYLDKAAINNLPLKTKLCKYMLW
jgi:hypothetical protein